MALCVDGCRLCDDTLLPLERLQYLEWDFGRENETIHLSSTFCSDVINLQRHQNGRDTSNVRTLIVATVCRIVNW